MKLTKILAVAACTIGLSVPAGATAQSADEWHYDAIIYVYLPTVGGTTTFPQTGGSDSATVDADKILKNLKFAFMGTLDASKGRWGIATDLMYLNVGDNKSQTRDFSIGGIQIPADASANAHFDLKGWVWTTAATYEVVSAPQARLHLLAGARLLSVRENFNWQLSGNVGPVPLPGRQGSSEAKVDNWDAIVGVRGRLMFGSNGEWFVPYYVDVGTGNSDLTWQAIGGLGYAFKWGDIIAAWRYLDYNMKSGKDIQSVNFNGPAIGVGLRW